MRQLLLIAYAYETAKQDLRQIVMREFYLTKTRKEAV
jgi:hypothetical protein